MLGFCNDPVLIINLAFKSWMSGEELILTPKEYALLSRLMLKAGSPVHREILYNDIYNWDNEPSTNTLEVHKSGS